MKKLTILIDMDDVLEELTETWISEINRKFGTSVKSSDVVSWDIAQYFPSLSKNQVFSPLHDPEFWNKLHTTKYAYDVVKQLIADGHKIRIVTASHPKTIVPKIDFLLKEFPYLKWNDVIIAHDKSLVSGDVMIDDGVHNLVNSPCRKLLFHRYHNQSYDAEANGMTRVFGWKEIYQIIKNMAGGKS